MLLTATALIASHALCILPTGLPHERTGGDPPAVRHPHPARRLIVDGAEGKVTLGYRTVDFNGERVDEIGPGAEWHLAFATFLENEVPLRAGEVSIAPGTWALRARRSDDGKTFQLVLRDAKLMQQLRQAGRGMRGLEGEELAAKRAELEKMQQRLESEALRLPELAFVDEDTDHMVCTLLNRGYSVAGPSDPTPTGGITVDLRITFGHLRCGTRLVETLESEPEKEDMVEASGRSGGH